MDSTQDLHPSSGAERSQMGESAGCDDSFQEVSYHYDEQSATPDLATPAMPPAAPMADLGTTNDRVQQACHIVMQAWLYECCAPELLPYTFNLSEDARWYLELLGDTDDQLALMQPSLDPHRRLSLSLNEKARHRAKRLVRQYKAVRAAKILDDPAFVLSMATECQEAVHLPSPLDLSEDRLVRSLASLSEGLRYSTAPERDREFARMVHFTVNAESVSIDEMMQHVDTRSRRAARLLEVLGALAMRNSRERNAPPSSAAGTPSGRSSIPASVASNPRTSELSVLRTPTGGGMVASSFGRSSVGGGERHSEVEGSETLPSGSCFCAEYDSFRDLVFQEVLGVLR